MFKAHTKKRENNQSSFTTFTTVSTFTATEIQEDLKHLLTLKNTFIDNL